MWENRSVKAYTVVVHEEPDCGFWGEGLALPGCYSQGETVDELKRNIREAIAGVLEVLKEEGRQLGGTCRFSTWRFEAVYRT